MTRQAYWMLHVALLVTTASVMGSDSCCKTTGTIVDCFSCNLTSIPAFLLTSSTTDLLLANNRISGIPNGTFINSTSLRRLVLINNPLSGLNANTFQGLESMQHLEIGSRVLHDAVEPLPTNIFHPLGNIRKLLLYFKYPTEVSGGVFMEITQLEALVMSMEPRSDLGSEFRNLQHLKSLHIMRVMRNTSTHPGCLEYVTQNTFATVPHLEKLQITQCIRDIDPDALVQFTSLSSLVLPCNSELLVLDVATAIRNMQKSTLRTLILDGCRNLGHGESNRYYELGRAMLNSSNFAELINLSLKWTNLISLDYALLDYMPKIRQITVSYNALYRTRQHQSIIKYFQHINNTLLESIDASNLFYEGRPSRICQIAPWGSETMHFRQPPNFIMTPTPQMTTSQYPVINYLGNTREIYKKIPPSLHYVYFDNIGPMAHWHPAEINPDNNILYLAGSNSKIKMLPLIKGLNKLRGLDINNNELMYMAPDLLHYLPCLIYLNLGHNKLENLELVKFFGPGSSLQWLDLSFNNFRTISSHLLNYLPNIVNISFSGNPLVNVQFDLHNNKQLQALDLSNCALVNLAESFMKDLDDLQSRVNHSLSVSLSKNAFECSCSTLDMVHWFKHTAVNITDRETINCAYRNTSVAIIDLDDQELSKECVRHTTSMAAIVLSLVGIVSVVGILLILLYQFRWHVRWYVYRTRRAIRHCFRKPHADFLMQELTDESHAFVAYNHREDNEWVANELIPVVEKQWGLKVCIGARDFMVGKPIAENIAQAIDDNRKTILVITPAFTSSEWCIFEMHMALVKGLECLIIIYKEEVPVGKMCKTLKMLMKSVNYIGYSQEAQELFWDRLKVSLKGNYYR